jgi:exonuclease I
VYALLDQQTHLPADADAALYQGFVSDADRALVRRFRLAPIADRAHLANRFADERLRTLAFRYRARHYPDSLSAIELGLWRQECRKLLERRALAPVTARDRQTTVALDDDLQADLQRWEQRARSYAGLS